MKTTTFYGLDGSNPLHMLASLGAFRVLCIHDQQARMSWRMSNSWHPIYHTIFDEEQIKCLLAEYLSRLGRCNATANVTSNRLVRDLSAKLKKAKGKFKQAKKQALDECKTMKLDRVDRSRYMENAIAASSVGVERLVKELEQAQIALTDSLGEGIAHLGDIIGVSPIIFRNRSKSAVEAWFRLENMQLAEALSAQAVDGFCQDGKIKPTPFSFGNGASNQCLLKDFRNCAIKADAESVHAVMNGSAQPQAGVTGLNWDPEDQKSHALQWKDPAVGGKAEPVTNALAFIGLMFYTVVPSTHGIAATGWQDTRGERGFFWPVWEVPLNLLVVRSLLNAKISVQGGVGVEIQYFSRCINPTGRRNFFAPAKPL